MRNNVDPVVLHEILEKSRHQFKMRAAIWLFLTEKRTKAELSRLLGVSRQHISRTICDFLQKNAHKLFTDGI